MTINISQFWLHAERRDAIIARWRGIDRPLEMRGDWASKKTVATKAARETTKKNQTNA